VRIRDFRVVEILPDSQVPTGGTLASDPQGGIWIATPKGDLALFRRGVLQTFPLKTSGDPVIHQIIVQGDGSVLAGSANGLVALRNGKVDKLTSKNGLPCDFVTSFVKDSDQRWWLSTDCGVVELADSELQRWWAAPQTRVRARVYDEADGAQAGRPNFNSAAYANGRVWFAQGNTVQMLDPARLPEKSFPAATYIRSVTVDRKELPVGGDLKVPPHPRDLQIDYTSPSFSTPQKIKFRYRLDGYERDWRDAGTRRQAFYTDLPPGEYTFRVIAASSDDVWNERAATLAFAVTPAFYQTTWFRVLCAMMLGALLWVAYQLRIRRLQHDFHVTLDARVAERTRIARELHDTLLQSFHGLLPLLQAVSPMLPDRSKAKEKLEKAIQLAAHAVTEGRDAVQGLRNSTLQQNDLALAIGTLGEELAADSHNYRSAFRVAVEGECRELHPIVRDEIYRIAAEALRNAFRHAQAQHVEVEVRYDDEQYRLRIRDDGKGFDQATLSGKGTEGHYGVPGMRERATLIGGKLTLWSEVDAGTEVELSIPASHAYSKASSPRSWVAEKVMGQGDISDS
jgi:signal transduction histidine kinase